MVLDHLLQKRVLSQQSKPRLTVPPAEPAGAASTSLLGHPDLSHRYSGSEREGD